jgi:transmembrane sensor
LELQELRQLIAKYNAGKASAEEASFVEEWYDSVQGEDIVLNEEELGEVKRTISEHILLKRRRTVPMYIRWLAAATVLLAVGVGLYLFKSTSTHDVAPGGSKAILTLADGTQFQLDNLKDGALADGATISKNTIVFNKTRFPASENVVTTPRGGMYALILADGTKIWVNSASSLKFPTFFTGKERKVELTGEAYFEVARNEKMPFRVISGKQTIEVLGTHFNISNYGDEPAITTTLLEGSIRVLNGSESVLLKAGQQSTISQEKIEINNNADSSEVMAWKNGMFQFNDADIQTIMRQLGRWYDVDVVYNGKVPADQFNGRISRNVNLSGVLKILTLSGINFKIEGRKIILD